MLWVGNGQPKPKIFSCSCFAHDNYDVCGTKHTTQKGLTEIKTVHEIPQGHISLKSPCYNSFWHGSKSTVQIADNFYSLETEHQ